MKPLKIQFQEICKKDKSPLHVVERDYLQSWILFAMTQVPTLNTTLIFKGGTALKKCYFGDYRFSEDLDFTGKETSPEGIRLESALKDACHLAETLLQEFAPIYLKLERYTEKKPHPHQQEAFAIRAQFPWHREPLCKILVEITKGEHLAFNPEKRNIIHNYEERLDTKIAVYSLEEIVLEKLRAILQNTKKLHERGWGRSRARDYYDLWRIINTYTDLDRSNMKELLLEKCLGKEVSFIRVEDFFQDIMVSSAKTTWDQSLESLVDHLPPLTNVLENLKPQVEHLLGLSKG